VTKSAELPFYRIADYPSEICGTAVLTRLIDGLGFRFQWATEGLSEEDVAFRPSPGSMSIAELAGHIWGLVNWVSISVSGTRYEKPADFAQLRTRVLEMLVALRGAVVEMGDAGFRSVTIEDLAFWHIINGPLSDALTHVGQINAFRRLAGNPSPEARVFPGLPPKE
jgi:hypothetical protein